MYDIPSFILKNVLLAWSRNAGNSRRLIAASLFCQFCGMVFLIYVSVQQLPKEIAYIGWLVFGIGLFVALLVAVQQQIHNNEVETLDFRNAQERARDNPERPEFTWDLARTKLERYLDRNLYEVRAIFLLTTAVMLGGFFLIVFGLFKAFSEPASLNVSIVSSASGVLISFVGGSFMLIYRSVLAQSASYVGILERINAVGMAVQIVSTVPDTDKNLRAETTAALASALLVMYESKVPNGKTGGTE